MTKPIEQMDFHECMEHLGKFDEVCLAYGDHHRLRMRLRQLCMDKAKESTSKENGKW